MNPQQTFEKYCRENNIEEVEKILQDKSFLGHAGIGYNYSTGIYQAADYNKLEMVKFLLEKDDCQQYININFENNCILKTACRQNYFEIIHYLMLDYQMKLTSDLFMPNYEHCNYIMELYSKRNLKNNLQEKHPEKNIKTKTLKI